MKRTSIRSLLVLIALPLAGCPKDIPGGSHGNSGVDPNSCGNYAASDAGRKLKAFLSATAQLSDQTEATVAVVKDSCMIMGKELGMTDADLAGETKDSCAKVYAKIDANLKVAFKAKAGLKITYKPAVCKANIDASAQAAAECEGKATADIGASCSGVCHGTCDGTCSGTAGTGGSSGQCDGQCSGTCHGSCEGHADVDASAQCKANAEVKASAEIECTPPEVTVDMDASLVVDNATATATVKALRDGLPKILMVKARIAPLQSAFVSWSASAKELESSGATLARSFGEQALCISGQIAAAVKMATHIEANVSVSVEVSASASATAGG